jgi:hypothetical protein
MSFALVSIFSFSSSIAQIKLNESFSGNQFPPEGWSVFDLQGTGSTWIKSEKYCRSGEGCAVSEFDTTYGNSFLVTKRIVPSQNDSLIFYLRQTFYRVYSDTLKICVSSSDSLPSSMSSILLTIRDGLNYPPHQLYSRYAISLNQFAGDTIWLGFRHINVNGDILRVDDVRVGNALQNDVAISEILSPRDVVGICSSDSLVPKAVVSNTGLSGQTSQFAVTCNVSGPVNYLITVNTTIAAGETKELSFASIVLNQPGYYTVKVYSGLLNDQNRQNDTLSGSFIVRQYSSGLGDGGYFFASSEICGQPQGIRPEYCWKDTSESLLLLQDGRDLSGGFLRGDLDNGYFALGNFLPPGKGIRFFEKEFDSLYVSLNGLLAFRYCPQLLLPEPPDSGAILRGNNEFVAPLWMNYENSIPGLKNRISYKVAGNFLVVTFDRMQLKDGDSLSYASFQVAVSLNHPQNQNSEILFQYSASNTGATFKNDFYAKIEKNCFAGIVSQGEELVYRHKTDGRYFDAGRLFVNDMAIEIGPDAAKLNSKCSMLTVNALLEGYNLRSDTIVIALHDYASPTATIESVKAILATGGTAIAAFTLADDVTGYFISIKHHNSIETWSKDSALSFDNSAMFYDFTRDTLQAYGNNMKMINGKAYIFSGDVNQDMQIEITDASLVNNDVFDYAMGYRDTDLNGDGIVDSSDLVLVDRNALRYVFAVIPSSAGSNPVTLSPGKLK